MDVGARAHMSSPSFQKPKSQYLFNHKFALGPSNPFLTRTRKTAFRFLLGAGVLDEILQAIANSLRCALYTLSRVRVA